MKIDLIPVGKENKIDRKTLMQKAGIKKEVEFKETIFKLKARYIIFYDEGYYRPSTIQEYKAFIDKCESKEQEMKWLIGIAEKEMEGLNGD